MPTRPDQWQVAAIASHIVEWPATSWYRVLPPEYLVVNRLAGNVETARHAREAIRQSRDRAARGRHGLAHYDNALAYAFRFPRSQDNGRFNSAASYKGVLYASLNEETALAERAYQQVRLLRERGRPLTTPITMVGVTRIGFDTLPCRVCDVTAAPFNTESSWMDPQSDYKATQTFAEKARAAEAQAIVYPSARDLAARANLALFDYQRLAQRQLDRRRVRDWFMSAATSTVDLQTSAGAHVRIAFDANGAPCPPSTGPLSSI